jgi:hypothetical protein
MTTGMEVCRGLAMETPSRPWSEPVVPYGLAETMLITPSGWDADRGDARGPAVDAYEGGRMTAITARDLARGPR